MLSKSAKHNPNYLCKIVEIKNLRKHPNADRLLVFTVDGNDIITSNQTQEGTIGIYFPLECQIADSYLKANNEYKTKELNSDPLQAPGFFEDKRRVKAVRLRGEKSMGYVAPISTLEYLLGNKYTDLTGSIGEEFDTVKGEEIVKKYVIKKQQGEGGLNAQRNKKIKESKIIENQFRLHYDTAQLKKNLHRIKPEDVISISWKLHGTSFVSSKILCKRSLRWYERIAKFFKVRVVESEYGNIFSSRNVIKNDDINKTPQHYYGSNIHADVNEVLKENLLDGETIYGEAVGFTPTGAAIQKGYDYGCKPNEFKIYIYRVTYTSPTGKVVELPYNQVVERAIQLGVEACPLIYFGRADYWNNTKVLGGTYPVLTQEEWSADFLKKLEAAYVHDQDCQFCTNKVPAEGVVVRKEDLVVEALKLKAFRFLEWETKELDKGEVNIEDEVEEVTE